MTLDMKLQVFSSIDIKIFEKVLKDSLEIDILPPKKVLIIGDVGNETNASPIISSAYYKAAKNLGLDTELQIQNHKFISDNIDAVLSKKLNLLPKNSIIILNLSSRLGKFDYQNLSFRQFCQKKEHRYLSSSGLRNVDKSKLFYFIKALDVDFKKQKLLGQKLAESLSNAYEVNVQTKIGTDMLFKINNRKAINNSGIYADWGKGGNMPAGEVYISPLEDLSEGRLVIDGSVRTWKKTIIPTEPITIDIEKGSISKIHNSAMSKLLKETFIWASKRTHINPENVKKVAELGIGTNKSAKIIGTTIVDEKSFETAHVAFGSNKWMGGKIKTVTHFDQVFRNPIIRIDGRLFRF